MRHCRRFLAGIPHWKAGHPCATHPSATASPQRGRTFDLHVLGTPPAFILSQDQTRHPKRKKHATHGEPRESSLGELRSRPSCCSCRCPLLGCSQMLLAFVPSAPMRSKRREGSILTGTACWCAVHDATLVRWFFALTFALTKKQLLFCFPLFSC